jgi:hypothetical protein
MRLTATLTLLLLAALSSLAQSADAVQKSLKTHAGAIQAWGSDKTLVAAVKTQNARKVTAAEVQRIDKAWTGGGEAALVKQLTTGPCSDHLRQLIAQHPSFGETMLMDDQGALVCASERTSDYWQGDESKWQRGFDGGKGAVFIDRPRFDDSAVANLAQISVPVLDGGKVIGVLTVGVDIRKQD